jgi:hypothetical protein
VSRWDHLSESFLLYWQAREKEMYLAGVTDPYRTKKGERTAGQLSAINIARGNLRAIDRELRRRHA